MVPSKMFRGKAVLVVLSLMALCGGARAQSGRGNVSGTVHDSTGAVVPGAKVSVTNVATNETTALETGASGDYTAPNIPVGTYNVRVQKEGFNEADVKNIIVNAVETARIDVSL